MAKIHITLKSLHGTQDEPNAHLPMRNRLAARASDMSDAEGVNKYSVVKVALHEYNYSVVLHAPWYEPLVQFVSQLI